ncbi:hypothetical protein BU16DRAFT_215933 [Lophium mytilinum]|uniref:Uncharacterized protein n=1 Tax=Lophium mytilinum TaxID=390894 RepID=A0A6A6QA45_9PEZI|nr:hypothetical protein BU16DRAFT_215933 [Lophium mytilinum]
MLVRPNGTASLPFLYRNLAWCLPIVGGLVLDGDSARTQAASQPTIPRTYMLPRSFFCQLRHAAPPGLDAVGQRSSCPPLQLIMQPFSLANCCMSTRRRTQRGAKGPQPAAPSLARSRASTRQMRRATSPLALLPPRSPRGSLIRLQNVSTGRWRCRSHQTDSRGLRASQTLMACKSRNPSPIPLILSKPEDHSFPT